LHDAARKTVWLYVRGEVAPGRLVRGVAEIGAASGMDAVILVFVSAFCSNPCGLKRAVKIASCPAPNLMAFPAARKIKTPAIKPTVKNAATSRRCVGRSQPGNRGV